MRRSAIALARAALLATLVTPLSIGLALASHEAPRFGLTPVGAEGTYFEVTMRPGETRFLEVELANFGEEEAAARTYAADVYSIVNGGFGAELFGDEPSGTTRWLDFPTQELTLGPRDSVVIGFELSVPDGTPPGEHLTALVVENVDAFVAPGDDDIGVEQVNRSAIAVAIDVPGPRRPGLEIAAVGHHLANDQSVVSFEVANTGNAHLKPAGEFVLRNAAGDELASSAPVMDSLYAGSSTFLEAPLASRLRPGDYCAELRLTDEATGASAATECLPFSVEAPTAAEASGDGSQTIPVVQPVIDAAGRDPRVLATLLLVPVAIIAAAVLVLRRRRRRASPGEPPPPSPPSQDSAPSTDLPAPAPIQEPEGPASSFEWPSAEPLPTRHAAQPPVSANRELLALLRDQFSQLSTIERAWLIERDADITVVAIEGAAGLAPADGARIAGALQGRAAGLATERPLRVVYVQGAGPVARATGAATPFYRRAASQGQLGA